MPDMETVDSSLLQEVGYDPDLEKLTVVFRTTGGRYVYSGVPQKTYDAMMAAESVGKFFLHFIKNKFPFRQE